MNKAFSRRLLTLKDTISPFSYFETKLCSRRQQIDWQRSAREQNERKKFCPFTFCRFRYFRKVEWSYSSQPPRGPPDCWRNICRKNNDMQIVHHTATLFSSYDDAARTSFKEIEWLRMQFC